MYRGVHPMLALAGFEQLSEAQLILNAMKQSKSLGYCKSNDNVIIVSCSDGYKDMSQPLTVTMRTIV